MNRQKEQKGQAAPLKSKPFCDCDNCSSNDCPECPDILQKLGITMTEKSCDFGSKVAGSKCSAKGSSKKSTPKRSSLLDVVSPERDCICEVIARAVRSNVHTNIGLTERRNSTNEKRNSEAIDPTKE